MKSGLLPCVIPVDSARTTFVAVDYWGLRLGIQGYFLTHMHMDHLADFSESWRGGTIYCSAITKALLKLKFPSLQAPVIALEEGEPLQLDFNDGRSSLRVQVFDAHHCAGSVQFLFEGEWGRILHTGDCRWEASPALLPPELLRAPLDYLLLDNTYAHPRHQHPPRARAAQEVIRLVRAHPEHKILIAVDGLGKEELLAAVAEAVGHPVYVPAQRLQAIRVMGLPESCFTTNKDASRVHAVPRWSVEPASLERRSQHGRVLAVVPTGWEREEGALGPATQCARPPHEAQVRRVPYSLHCSFAELQALVAALRPRTLLGTVAGADPDWLRRFQHLTRAPPSTASPQLLAPMPVPLLPPPPPPPASPPPPSVSLGGCVRTRRRGWGGRNGTRVRRACGRADDATSPRQHMKELDREGSLSALRSRNDAPHDHPSQCGVGGVDTAAGDGADELGRRDEAREVQVRPKRHTGAVWSFWYAVMARGVRRRRCGAGATKQDAKCGDALLGGPCPTKEGDLSQSQTGKPARLCKHLAGDANIAPFGATLAAYAKAYQDAPEGIDCKMSEPALEVLGASHEIELPVLVSGCNDRTTNELEADPRKIPTAAVRALGVLGRGIGKCSRRNASGA